MYKQSGDSNFGRATTRSRNANVASQQYLKHVKQKQEAQAKFVRGFIFMLFLAIVALVGTFCVAIKTDFCATHFGKSSPITKFFANMASKNSDKANADFSLPIIGRRKNILLLGVDASENPDDLWTGTRTDTIILLNIDPKSKSINALSIPRDSKVYLPRNNGVQKINAAHAIGGIEMTVETIEDTLGVHIDKYIMVHDNAVKSIVEALDGVDVYVEKNMHYNDYAGRLHINLNKGYQHLNPEQAVGYLRFRHDAMGDIGRTQRQQWFLRGVLKELKRPETVTKIPDIVNVAKKYIKTNMSLYELTQFAMMTKSLDMDKIEIAMLPGAPNKSGVISYWILDPDKTQEVVNRLIYRRRVSDDFVNPPTASVVFTDAKYSEAQTVMADLKAAGVTIACQSHISRTHSQFIAHKPRISNEFYNRLKKEYPSLKGFQFVYDPSVYLCGDTDFTIVVAGK